MYCQSCLFLYLLGVIHSDAQDKVSSQLDLIDNILVFPLLTNEYTTLRAPDPEGGGKEGKSFSASSDVVGHYQWIVIMECMAEICGRAHSVIPFEVVRVSDDPEDDRWGAIRRRLSDSLLECHVSSPGGSITTLNVGNADVVMEAVLAVKRPRSWKDRLIGTDLRAEDRTETSTKDEDDDDLDLLDEDIVRSSMNGILAIEFSDWINKLLIKDMEHKVQPGLPGHMYKRKILWEIGEMIGRVAKLDFNTNNGVRGKFTRIALYINLEKALISQVLINGALQRIEYEYLPTVCFSYGHYGHT
ncbi:hypothetical protein Gotur_017314 [Gossypium turneri]